MPPPKAKLHQSTGRLKNINNSYTNNSTSNNQAVGNNQNNRNTQTDRNRVNNRNNNAPTMVVGSGPSTGSGESPAIEQFELELYWCIQVSNPLNFHKN